MPRALCNNHIKFVSTIYLNVTSLKKMLTTDLCSCLIRIFVFFLTNCICNSEIENHALKLKICYYETW